MPDALKIRRIDTRRDDARAAIAELRKQLSPRGDVVSEAGRQKTIEVFGEELSPQRVVERICDDVRQRGLPAVLEYTSKLDKADLSPETLRVPEDEMARAHRAASPEFLNCVSHVRDSVEAFQRTAQR